MSQLQSGDRAPAFTLKNQDAEPVKLSAYKGRKVLIYFYPKADTPGCTTQSCELQEALPDFDAVGVDVIGISPDEPPALKKFADKFGFSFPLLSDPEHKIADKYATWGEKSMYGNKYMGIIRSSFLVDEKGKISHTWYKISPKKTVPEAKKALR